MGESGSNPWSIKNQCLHNCLFFRELQSRKKNKDYATTAFTWLSPRSNSRGQCQ